MMRENGSRRTCRNSFDHDREEAPHRAPSRRCASAASTWWMKTSSSDGRIRSIEAAGFAGRGERPLDRRPALAGVADDDVDPGPEDGGLDRPGLRADRLEGLADPGRGHLQHRVPGEDALQLGDRAQRHEAAGVDEGEAVAVLGLVEVVGGHEDGHPVRRHLVDEPPEAAARDRVDAARGLVEEDDAGPVHHGAGQREPLLPAARQLAGEAVLLALEPRHVDGPGLALAGLGPAQAVDAAEEAEVLRRP